MTGCVGKADSLVENNSQVFWKIIIQVGEHCRAFTTSAIKQGRINRKFSSCIADFGH